MTLAAVLRHLAFAGGLALLSAVVVRLMIGIGVMDTPDARKSHSRPTPKGGGVGVLAERCLAAAFVVLNWSIWQLMSLQASAKWRCRRSTHMLSFSFSMCIFSSTRPAGPARV